MTDQADTGPIAHRREGGHWLVFEEQRATGGPVTGCHCGFVADVLADAGWGDSVLDHFETVVRAETADEVRALRAENAEALRLVQLARDILFMLARRPGLLGHFLDTDDNDGQRFRERAAELGITPSAEVQARADELDALSAALSQSGQPTGGA